MSNAETHTVSMPGELWKLVDDHAASNHTKVSQVFQDAIKNYLLDNDMKGKRLRIFDVVFMLLLFVIILLLLVVVL